MYYLKRKMKKGFIKNIFNFEGLEIKPKSKRHENIKKVTIIDKKLKNNYSIKQMDKHLKRIYDKIFAFLTSDDDSENGIKICLGEIEKCKSALFNKYKEALQNKKYKEYLAKIALIETEFRDKYYEREYYANIIKNMYKDLGTMEEEEIKGKSR